MIMISPWWSLTHQGLSNSTKNIAMGLMVWEISTNKQTNHTFLISKVSNMLHIISWCFIHNKWADFWNCFR